MRFQEFKTTLKDNTPVIIREACVEDAEQLLAMLKQSTATTDNLLISADEIAFTVKEEEAWIKSIIESPKALLLVAVIDGKIIADTDVRIGLYKKTEHLGELGMTIIEEWRNKGLGTILMNALIAWAKEKTSLEALVLEVFSVNEQGIALYRKCGFEEKARLKNYFKMSNGDYVDRIIMTYQL